MRIDPKRLEEFKAYTIPQIFAKQAEVLRGKPAIRKKYLGIWETITWEKYLKFVKHVAYGLSRVGVKRGDHVAILVDNEPEWLFAELGSQALGAITLNLFTSLMAKELSVLLNRFGARVVFAQDQGQVDKLISIRKEIEGVEKVVYVDPTGMSYYSDPWLISFRDLLDLGREAEEKDPGFFERELSQGRKEDVNLMVMTSGTSGLPKFVMFAHQNIVDMALKWIESSPIEIGDNWISITPSAWIMEQIWGIGVSILSGMVMNFPEMPETLAEDCREIGPSFILTLPRFWEELASRIKVKMQDAGALKKWFYDLGLKIGETCFKRELEELSLPFHLRFLKKLFALLVYNPLLDRVGCSRIKQAITAGHPISPEVIRFLRSIGLNLKQGYGLTEAGGVFQVHPDGEIKLETVGKPLPRTEVKISEDNEILVSTPSLFVGYYQDEETRRKVLENGWLRTGDVGYLDEEGHLVVIGRKEEIMRLRGGESFSPDFIEARLKVSPYIKEAVVFGDGKDYVTGFICLDFVNVRSWAEARMIPYTTYSDLSQQPIVQDLILGEVRRINEQIPLPIRVKKIILLHKMLDPDDEELTRTGKVKRKFVSEKYKDLVEDMYEGKTESQVKDTVVYRDGHISTIFRKVKILDVE